MSDTTHIDEDEVLRRMLSTPPKPHESRKESMRPQRLEDVEISPEAEMRFRAAVHAAVRRKEP